ncbi:hypothetical protein FLJC2902T_13950 [Flavobacterium limnosediminis JC2902]|uniref:BIG2 domain-containing protein n=1 Tax=Flavobacterium limnosediminis JC2902 TaxID=1341181 RepID=V6SQ40_9FLAO|nr:Ig-like domain-containing protein [Flavobacterium limnosediminis]ESU28798.1 hypothetical protein FLJC2902T_13950 [Flavobacterium limnosediminis JC2902]
MKKILTLLVVLIFGYSVQAQNSPNDCVNAITVCGNGTFSSNASGIGNIQEISGSCSSFEHNSLWLRINIVQSGTLGFDLIPNDPAITVDYDFWVFGPNRNCGAGLGAPIRCCTTNPAAAGLPNNHTGLNNTTATTAGPGANGNGYVRYLDVVAGQFYYIVIDRPHGDGGFEIRWNGTAMNGSGAFPIPPTANAIPDFITCSITPNVGIFNLNTVRSQINSDLTNNTISFYTTFANAVDGVSPLPDIYGNVTNPQRIYAKVVNNTSGCFTITDFLLRVVQVPTATMSLSRTQICSGESVTVTFTGSPGATVDYRIDGGPLQSALLDAAGTFSFTESLTANRTYTLATVKVLNSSNVVICSQNINNSQTVTVNPLPTISGSLGVCLSGTSQLTGSGTPAAVSPWTSSDTAVATVSATGLVTGIALGTAVITYTDSNGCFNTATVTVNALPTVSGVATVCVNATTQLTGSGTPAASNAWVSSNTVIATVSSAGLVTGVSAGSATITYTDNNGCSASMTVTIDAAPTIGGTLSACQNATTQLTGSGTPAAVNPWTSSNTAVATVNATGLVTGVSAGTVTITYTINGGCSATAVVTINALPTISGTPSGCLASTTQLTGSGTPAAVNPWTSSNPAVATVNASGLVSAVSTGTTTITYTDANGCSNTFVFTVNVTPTVSGNNAVCVNATTQLTGSGTPASSNAWASSNTAVATVNATGLVTGVSVGTATITYTDVNGCSSTSNITVNALPTISGTLLICQGGTTQLTGSGTPAVVNPWISSNTAVATVDAAGLVTSVSAGTAVITYTNDNGCFVSTSVFVNALPTISGALTACIGSTSQLTGSGTPAASNAWVSSNTAVATISATGLITGVSVGTSTITYMDANGCSTTAVVNILTNPTATIAISGATTICTGSTTTITISGSPNATVNYTVNGTPANIFIPAAGTVTFTTANLSVQTTYQLVDISAGSGCTSPLSQSVVVDIAPQPTASISGTTSVCFNSSTTITFTGTAGATVQYTVNAGPNQSVILGAGGTATVNTGNLSADATYTLVDVTAGTVPNCIETLSGSAIVTVVQTPTVAANPASQLLCSGQLTGIQLQGTVPNTTFSWTYTQTGGVTGASNGTGAVISQMLTTGTAVGTVTYTITPSVGSCVGNPITVDITVTPVPNIVVNVTEQSICTGGTTNITMSSAIPTTTFNWNVVQNSGVTGATGGTGASINQVLTASGTTIGQATYTITPINNGCPGVPETVTVTVYPNPNVTASPQTSSLCSGETTNIVLTSNVPGTTFSWLVAQSPGVSGAFSDTGDTISQTLTTLGMAQGTVTYTVTPVVNGCTGQSIDVTVTVNPIPELFTSGNPQPICSGEPSGILLTPFIPGTSIEWTVVQNGVSGASDGSASETTPGAGIPISQILTTTGNTQGTAIYTVTPVFNGCSGTPVTIVIEVNPLPSISIPDGVVCIDSITGALIFGYEMNTGLSDTDYDFQWYYGSDMTTIISTASSYTATQDGLYTVSIMNSSTSCDEVFMINVNESNPAQSATAVVTNYFEDSQAITVTVAGTGSYLYSLDGGAFQTSNVFLHVLPGEHTVTIHDTVGCTNIVLTGILTIGYPHFFTPNGDGYNDTWNIWSLSGNQPDSEIHIFDRYGKLIKQMVPAGTGWDGTYNGQVMPSTDYWFTVKYKENGAEKMFKAHFSMKR